MDTTKFAEHSTICEIPTPIQILYLQTCSFAQFSFPDLVQIK